MCLHLVEACYIQIYIVSGRRQCLSKPAIVTSACTRIHVYPSLLYTWGPSIPIVHMGAIHPYCTHGGHPSLLYTWGPSIRIVHMGVGHRTLVPMWKWWGLYCHIFSLTPSTPSSPHPPPMMIFGMAGVH